MLIAPIVFAGCAGLPANVERSESFAIRDTQNTRLGKAAQASIAPHPGKSGFHLLPGGLDAFVARAMLTHRAERSIDAQYYLLHNDLVGHLFLDLLLDAANRGVRVRLLVDDMALDDDQDISAAQLDAHPNIEIRVFNPFGRNIVRWLQYLTRLGEVTRRMHNKSFIVDNQVTVIGGRNIGNEYFDADPNLLFGDLDVLAVGPVVDQVSSVFDLYWNSPSAYPVASLVKGNSGPADLAAVERRLDEYIHKYAGSSYLRAMRDNPLLEQIRHWRIDFDWGQARVLYDDPAKITAARDQDHLKLVTQLNTYIDTVISELTIFSPYLVPGREGVAQLVQLRERGVRVRILTNSLGSTDVTPVHAGYARYRRYLLRAGIELYEIDETLTRQQRRDRKGPFRFLRGSLHAKSFVLDRQRVFIGSMNFDPRSVVENTELGVLIESADIAVEMNNWFDQIARKGAFRLALETDKEGAEKLFWHRTLDGESKIYTNEPNVGFWRRLGASLLQLLPLESQL